MVPAPLKASQIPCLYPVVKDWDNEQLVHQKFCIGGEINETKKYFLEPLEFLEESKRKNSKQRMCPGCSFTASQCISTGMIRVRVSEGYSILN